MEIHDGMPRPGRMFLSIVVPCCNEEEGLREFHRQMTVAARKLCGEKFELILVDDGSTDNTWKVINELSAKDFNVVAVRLARNHGRQLALTAGLSTVRADLVLVFATDALISFSMLPLRIATYIGALLTTILTFVGAGAVISWILSGTVPGWTSLTLLVVMISSVQLLVLGLIGEYVGRTYIQSKNRPLFMISHIHRRPRLPRRL